MVRETESEQNLTSSISLHPERDTISSEGQRNANEGNELKNYLHIIKRTKGGKWESENSVKMIGLLTNWEINIRYTNMTELCFPGAWFQRTLLSVKLNPGSKQPARGWKAVLLVKAKMIIFLFTAKLLPTK